MPESNHNSYMELAENAFQSTCALEELKKASAYFYTYPNAFLALIAVDNPETELNGYINGRDINLSSFIMPVSFNIKDITFDGEQFLFKDKKGRALRRTLGQLRAIWDLIPTHPSQRDAQMIEDAFYKACAAPDKEVVSTPLGVFQWEGYTSGYNAAVDAPPFGTLYLTVKACTSIELENAFSKVNAILTCLKDYDKAARSMGDEEEEGTPSSLIVYPNGAFDLTYDLTDDDYCDFVGVQFSAKGDALASYYG